MPKNLGISRQMAVAAAVVGVVCVLGAVLIAGIIYGLKDVGPYVPAILTVFGGALTSLVAALKSTEAADSIAKLTRAVIDLAQRVSAIDGKGAPEV